MNQVALVYPRCTTSVKQLQRFLYHNAGYEYAARTDSIGQPFFGIEGSVSSGTLWLDRCGNIRTEIRDYE